MMNKHSVNYLLLVLLIAGALLSCKKKKEEAKPEEPAPVPAKTDYRAPFEGKFSGICLFYHDDFSPSTGPLGPHNTFEATTMCTITVKKVAGTDSLLYAEEFFYSEKNARDTILIQPGGTYMYSDSQHFSEVTFKQDSLIIHTYEISGANGSIKNGLKFSCKK